MANVNIRIEDKLRDEVHEYFSSVGITPSEAIRGLYEYVKTRRKMPFRQEILSDEDAELLALARARAEKPPSSRRRISLDEFENLQPRNRR